MKRRIGAHSLALATTSMLAIAQELKPPTVVSPEVQADRRVTLRVWAPKASEVQMLGDWARAPESLTKSGDGVWTATIGPLEPNIYTYGFLVDGVYTSDASCRCTVAWAGRRGVSRFVVPGSPPLTWEEHGVPRGTLHYETRFSPRLKRAHRFVVYTPAGYQPAGSRKYPVLLLLPGTPGDESDWTLGGGFADLMFDNLISDKRMVPTIVVMHASDVLRNGRRAANLAEFEPLVVEELVPEIRKRYRVEDGPTSWAIAGTSLGGEFAMTVGLRHPEVFRTVASFSGSLVQRDFDERFGKALAGSNPVWSKYRLIWLGCGSEDTVFLGDNKAFAAKLAQARIAHTYREFPGGHAQPVFRQQLAALLPKLFR